MAGKGRSQQQTLQYHVKWTSWRPAGQGKIAANPRRESTHAPDWVQCIILLSHEQSLDWSSPSFTNQPIVHKARNLSLSWCMLRLWSQGGLLHWKKQGRERDWCERERVLWAHKGTKGEDEGLRAKWLKTGGSVWLNGTMHGTAWV